MMRWSCPEDRADLELREQRLVCSRCGSSHDVTHGSPVFGAGETVAAEPAAFAELFSKMQDATSSSRTASPVARLRGRGCVGFELSLTVCVVGGAVGRPTGRY